MVEVSDADKLGYVSLVDDDDDALRAVMCLNMSDICNSMFFYDFDIFPVITAEKLQHHSTILWFYISISFFLRIRAVTLESTASILGDIFECRSRMTPRNACIMDDSFVIFIFCAQHQRLLSKIQKEVQPRELRAREEPTYIVREEQQISGVPKVLIPSPRTGTYRTGHCMIMMT